MGISKKNKKSVARASKKEIQLDIINADGIIVHMNTKEYAISRIRPIGNSKGVILSNQLLEVAGLNTEAEVVIQAADGLIRIYRLQTTGVNTDLSTWDKQFKQAIKNGAKPENDLFEGMINEFDLKEW